METWRAIIGPSGEVMAMSAGGAYVMTEFGRNAVVIAKSIDNLIKDWRKRRIENAVQRGREENQKLWMEWLSRREEAESRGEDFIEPPPNGKA